MAHHERRAPHHSQNRARIVALAEVVFATYAYGNLHWYDRYEDDLIWFVNNVIGAKTIVDEHSNDLSWNHGIAHERLLSNINVPCVYLHAKESVSDTGVYLCATSHEQAGRAVGLIGDNCTLIETDTSDHTIHTVHRHTYIDAIDSLLK